MRPAAVSSAGADCGRAATIALSRVRGRRMRGKLGTGTEWVLEDREHGHVEKCTRCSHFGYRGPSNERLIAPCSHTLVGGSSGNRALPPPFGMTRTRVAIGSHRPSCCSPGPGTSGEERASRAAAPPGCRSTRIAINMPGCSARAAVGRRLPRRPMSVSCGIPLTKHAAFELFRSTRR